MTYKLFLDDERDPNFVYPNSGNWVVVRSYDDAVKYVEEHGWPELVSLDHDLGDSKSGKDFANYLVAKDLEEHSMPDNFQYKVHSANPTGAKNIRTLLDRYMQYKKETR